LISHRSPIGRCVVWMDPLSLQSELELSVSGVGKGRESHSEKMRYLCLGPLCVSSPLECLPTTDTPRVFEDLSCHIRQQIRKKAIADGSRRGHGLYYLSGDDLRIMENFFVSHATPDLATWQSTSQTCQLHFHHSYGKEITRYRYAYRPLCLTANLQTLYRCQAD